MDEGAQFDAQSACLAALSRLSGAEEGGLPSVTAGGHRVGFVLEGMAGPGSGTWTRFASLALGLANVGVFVHVLASRNLQRAFSGLRVDSVQWLPAQSRARRFVGRRARVEQFAADTGVHVIHIEDPPFPRIAGVPTIGSIHDLRFFHEPLMNLRSTEGLYQRLILGRQAENLTGIATLGPWAASEVTVRLGVPRSRVYVIPPIIVSEEHRGPRELLKLDNRFVLVLGHLERRKNVATVIRAAASPIWPKDHDLVIAGKDAGEEPNLRALAAKARCRVHFLGGVDDRTRWQLLEEAQLVLVPSLLEGFGIVAVESPLAGTPVLVADRSALPDLAGDPQAIVPALDPTAWAIRIAGLVDNHDSRQQLLAIQQVAARRFQPESVIPAVLAMHENVISRFGG